jgi:thioredoxin reductase
MIYDVLIVGGGPAGLAAALTLGRGCRRVLLCDSGPRRNAAAVEMHNFVTRDGTPPKEFRRIAREQLAEYPNVEVRDVVVESISGARDAFKAGDIQARRVLLATGMIDEMLPIEGFRELWGSSIFQCPYCHGWEVRGKRWGYLARPEEAAHFLPFALMLTAWTRDVVVFARDLPPEARERLDAAKVRVETAPVSRIRSGAVDLEGGAEVPCDVLFVHPPQRQIPLVGQLGLALDEHGFVAVDPMRRETSVPGIYAAGDLMTRMQAAIHAAAAGTHAAAMINFDLASGQ